MITYYAFAKNKRGKIEQLRVICSKRMPMIQSWTGKIYKSIKEAEEDMIKLNCNGVFI